MNTSRKYQRKPRKPALDEDMILAWADAYYKEHGDWPKQKSGPIEGTGDNWNRIDHALRLGLRGLLAHSSLAILLFERRGVPNRLAQPNLTEDQILAWADEHYRQFGSWPNQNSIRADSDGGKSWRAIDSALRRGLRGLPGGASLARLLSERRGKRNNADLPKLDTGQIVSWMQAFHERHGRYPNTEDGAIPEAAGETWHTLDNDLREGLRGLPGGSTLACLKQEQFGRRHPKNPPKLTEATILEWADTYFQRHREWPAQRHMTVDGEPEETWAAIDAALRTGYRGLPGGSSLARLLSQARHVRNSADLPRLDPERIRGWVQEYVQHHGRFPASKDMPIPGAGDDTWAKINAALRYGNRGLPGGSSLAYFIQEECGGRHKHDTPRLTHEIILEWADDHFQRHGYWPSKRDSTIDAAPKETWTRIDQALRSGYRGLPGNSSISRLLMEHRGKRSHVRREREDVALQVTG